MRKKYGNSSKSCFFTKIFFFSFGKVRILRTLFSVLIFGISCYGPLPIVHIYRPPLSMVFWPPTHGILIPYPWYIDPPIHGISNPLTMVFWPPIYLLIRNEGGQNTMGVQYTIWHQSFLHSWTITGFVIRLTRVSLVKQEQFTFLEHPSSVPVFCGVCVTRSLVLCVCFVDHCLSFCPALPLCCPSFDLRILITPFGFGILKLFLRKAVIHLIN
jgi:hypothetical protein